MSDTPTLYRQAWELNEHAPNAVYTVDHIGVYYEGYLVPVERCEHGMIDEHDYLADKVDEHGRKFVAAEWCDGSPTLEVTDDGSREA